VDNNGGDGSVNTVTAIGALTDNNQLKVAAEEAVADAVAARLVAIAMKTAMAMATMMTTKTAMAMVTVATTTTTTPAAAATALAGTTDNNQLKATAKETVAAVTAQRLGGSNGSSNGNGNGKGW
jgi:hypothetical protein